MTKLRDLLCAAACFMILAVTAPAGAVQADDQQELDRDGRHDNMAQRWIDAWNSHDANAVAVLFTRDAVYEDVTLGIVNHGPEQIRAFAQFFFTVVPDLHLTLVNRSQGGKSGTIEWVLSGTDVGIFKTGKTFAFRGVTVLDLRGDKISRNLDYYDNATFLRQLGLLPPGL